MAEWISSELSYLRHGAVLATGLLGNCKQKHPSQSRTRGKLKCDYDMRYGGIKRKYDVCTVYPQGVSELVPTKVFKYGFPAKSL